MEPVIFRENQATQLSWTSSSSVACLRYADERHASYFKQLKENIRSRAPVVQMTHTTHLRPLV